MLQKLTRMMKKGNKGFTLVELMIVVVIIGVLIAIAIPIYRSIQTNAEARACQANQRTMRSQLEVYHAEGNAYPANDAAFQTWLGDDDYFAEVPDCPVTGATYTYTYTAATGAITIVCSVAAHN